MARGHQKFQSQQKNAKKQADIKKSKGHDQKAAAKAALVYTCTVCRVCALDYKWNAEILYWELGIIEGQVPKSWLRQYCPE